MREPEAKRILRSMLTDFSPGSILHLLGDVFRENAEEACQYEDELAFERCKSLEAALYVVGIGVDGACPR